MKKKIMQGLVKVTSAVEWKIKINVFFARTLPSLPKLHSYDDDDEKISIWLMP